MVDVEAESSGITAAIASRRTVPAVTIVFTTIDVPKKAEPDYLLLKAGVFGFSEGVRAKL